MKDLYSFDKDLEELKVSYQKMYEAYERIFTRCGLTFRAVEADAGAIGGSGGTHEFMVLADSGEAAVVFCQECDYAANVEKAECLPKKVLTDNTFEGQNGEVHTPGTKTIDQVADLLKVNKTSLIKTMVFKGDDKYFLVLVRGDREINEIKVNNTLGPFVNLRMADAEEVSALLNCEPGFVGPVGIDKGIMIAADLEVTEMESAVCGANKKDYHLVNVRSGKDFFPDKIIDLRMVEPGEPCPRCKGVLKEARGIEVGQVFNLGKKYSECLKATYLDDKGNEQYCLMGCYGVGVSRTMAAAIEQNYDENGIIWPIPIAPYHCIIIPISLKDEEIVETAETLYQKLTASGVETVLDDRDERPGVRFKDADLVGYPLRLTIGKKTLAEGKVELYNRKTGDVQLLKVEDACNEIKSLVEESLQKMA